MTAGQRLFEEGERKGVAAGQQRLLLNQLRLKFGALPDAVVGRVESATTEHLDTWAARILTATTLAEVFSD